MTNEPIILLEREWSTRWNSGEEFLGLINEGDRKWTLAVFVYKCLDVSIYSLIPDELKDENGEYLGDFELPENTMATASVAWLTTRNT